MFYSFSGPPVSAEWDHFIARFEDREMGRATVAKTVDTHQCEQRDNLLSRTRTSGHYTPILLASTGWPTIYEASWFATDQSNMNHQTALHKDVDISATGAVIWLSLNVLRAERRPHWEGSQFSTPPTML